MKEISLTEIRMASAVIHAEMLNAKNVVGQKMFEQSPKIQIHIILMTWTKVYDSTLNKICSQQHKPSGTTTNAFLCIFY